MTMLIRRDQTRRMLALIHEAREIRTGPEQKRHLVADTAQESAGGPRLAPRQRDVLERLLRGASEKQVAFDLNLSQHTVHSYAKSIYSAYRVSSRAELLVRCLAG